MGLIQSLSYSPSLLQLAENDSETTNPINVNTIFDDLCMNLPEERDDNIA